MSLPERPPSAAQVLEPLKGFQRSAVAHAFHRLYTAEDSTRRFLIADEVGLGKTLIARGIIAQAIEHLWDKVDRIDVVYVCSNTTIANQNLKRLDIAKEISQASADRITMLPVNLQDIEGSKLNFVAFTPGTSFDLKSRTGRARERCLLYWMLQDIWEVTGVAGKNFWQATSRNTESWRERLKEFRKYRKISVSLQAAFRDALQARDEQSTAAGEPTLESRYRTCCAGFKRAATGSAANVEERSQIIQTLRAVLAKVCIQALQPDLVILDEFQRFKNLLDGDDDASELANELFSYSDETSDVRVLLLSATPYKMYTLQHEEAEDDHYADFLRTVDFLDPASDRTAAFRRDLAGYRSALYRLAAGGGDELPAIRQRIESMLRRVMSRTERTGATGERDGMLGDGAPWSMQVSREDVHAFLEIKAAGRELGRRVPVEHWKSAPYLLELMDGYELERGLLGRLDAGLSDPDLCAALEQRAHDRLPWEEVERYAPLAPPNTRLRAFIDDYLSEDTWQLLWIPPSLPQHTLGGAFATGHARGLTKRLIFSSWRVVPKAIASLTSYAVERLAMTSADAGASNGPEDYRRQSRDLLRISRDSTGRLTGLPVLALLLPSPTLARLGDPLTTGLHDGDTTPDLNAVLAVIRSRIADALAPLLPDTPRDGPDDQSWYWMAPILLDLEHDERSRGWWLRPDLHTQWATWEPDTERAEGDDTPKESESWRDHVREARRILHGRRPSGPPPEDLVDVLALMALAGPATAALRAFARVAGDAAYSDASVKDNAGALAFGLRSLFNGPEATAIIRSSQPDAPYWRQVLTYAASGGLGALLEEHVHLQRDLEGLFDVEPWVLAEEISEGTCQALTLTTRRIQGRAFHTDPDEQIVTAESRRLRCHFGARFGARGDDDAGAAISNDRVRRAFNAPFWPFVLASTSIGQEGLDFHAWCHAVVHWNLPSNPVDMEQREGRVHRYKGHAVRKNVARTHGLRASVESADAASDPWSLAFGLAAAECADDHGGLVPYWVHTAEGGAHIERHVPALPLSQDELRLDALRRSLALYRMVFGQPRQDDLIQFLLAHMPAEVLERHQAELRIDLAPRVPTDDPS